MTYSERNAVSKASNRVSTLRIQGKISASTEISINLELQALIRNNAPANLATMINNSSDEQLISLIG